MTRENPKFMPNPHHWMKSTNLGLTAETIAANSDVVVVGIDGGGLDDIITMAVVGRSKESKRWLIYSHSWISRDLYERRREYSTEAWGALVADEHLTVYDKPSDVTDSVVRTIERIEERNVLADQGIALDLHGVSLIFNAIAESSIGTDRIVGVRNGFHLNCAIKDLQERIIGRDVSHNGNSVMDAAVISAETEMHVNHVCIYKQHNGAFATALFALLYCANIMNARTRLPTRAEQKVPEKETATLTVGINFDDAKCALKDFEETIVGFQERHGPLLDRLLPCQISHMELEPRDVVVVKAKTNLTASQRDSIRASVEQAIPEGVKVLVLDRDFDIEVLSRGCRNDR